MITIRTKSLTQKEVDELYKVLSIASNELCNDSTGNCNNCTYKHLCDNFMYVLEFLKTAKGGKK